MMSGLREYKKQRTRESLTMATLRLSLERGIENVRVEDIAAEAGVSPRTFNNYFSSKYEALAARHIDRVRQAVAALRARPPDEPLWEAIHQASMSPWLAAGSTGRSPDADVLAATRALVNEEGMRGEVLKAVLRADVEFVAAVAERTGTDPERDLYPRLVAVTVTSAIQTAVETWLRADPPVPLAPLIDEALRQLAAGLPDPSTGTTREH
jgi:AcrR family transcriptional regulator